MRDGYQRGGGLIMQNFVDSCRDFLFTESNGAILQGFRQCSDKFEKIAGCCVKMDWGEGLW